MDKRTPQEDLFASLVNNLPGVKLSASHPQKAFVGERLDTASNFRPLPFYQTLACYLLYGKAASSAEDDFLETISDDDRHDLIEYAAFLLQAEKDLYAYGSQLDIVKRVQSGHFFLEAVALLSEKRVLFDVRPLSEEVKMVYQTFVQMEKEEQAKEEPDKEVVFSILYNYLLLAQNSFLGYETKNAVTFHTTHLDLDFIFSGLERRLCSKASLFEKYQQAKKQISPDQRQIRKPLIEDIVRYYAFTYIKTASTFACKRLEKLEMI